MVFVRRSVTLVLLEVKVGIAGKLAEVRFESDSDINAMGSIVCFGPTEGILASQNDDITCSINSRCAITIFRGRTASESVGGFGWDRDRDRF